ncbi:MAG: YaaR family protein [Clostridiales bacterium]|nr:YaaR family protein [Clostridiales bacterium]MCF8022254.1 YaaR family protein [Clostridiales bacterium]
MKISSTGKDKKNNYKTNYTKVNKTVAFSKSLSIVQKQNDEQELKAMLEKITLVGERLKKTLSVNDIYEYKKLVKDYLSSVVNNQYKISQDRTLYNGILSRVEVINQKIDELTNKFFEDQERNLFIAGEIDQIKGLLLNLLF